MVNPDGPDAANLVTWDGPDDPQNPKTWSFGRRWLATGLVSLITFMTPITSSMIAPAEDKIGQDLNIHSQFQLSLVFSIFLLAFVFGPFVLAPLSEIYGRVVVLQLASIFFLIWNLVCGFAQSEGQMIAFRFLSGLGACAPQTVGGGVIGDLWRNEERGTAAALYTLAPILGPSVGPIVGAWITERTTWRWSFWAVTIFGVCVEILVYFTLPETFGPRILHLKAERLRRETGNPNLRTAFELENRSLSHVMRNAAVRPIRLLFTQPIVIFLAAYMALVYGVFYLILSTFPLVWSDVYGESTGIAGLNYFSLAIGMTLGTQTTGRLIDVIYRRLAARTPSGTGRPEFRVPVIWAATALIAIGLFLYGWSIEYRLFWLVPDIGAAIFGCGGTAIFTATQTYTIDAYTVYAASAIGATAFTRSLAGFGFPLFAPALYARLGWGWANSLLAFIFLAVGYPGSLVLWFYGERLRKASPFAATTEEERQEDEKRKGTAAPEAAGDLERGPASSEDEPSSRDQGAEDHPSPRDEVAEEKEANSDRKSL